MTESRWDHYVMGHDGNGQSPEGLWVTASELAAEGSVYILGLGFDPRCLDGLRRFLDCIEDPRIIAIELPPPADIADPYAVELAEGNREAFDSLTRDRGTHFVAFPNVEEQASAGRNIAKELTGGGLLPSDAHVVVDISALPTSIFFPVIKGLLESHDLAKTDPSHMGGQLQIVASENPAVDMLIEEQGVTEAALVGGFRFQFDLDADQDTTVIWVPVIGENAEPVLRAVRERLSPDDICPVLPFPAKDPRRADRLVSEYQLFQHYDVRPHSIIHADERNPFDLYRTLSRFHRETREALNEIVESAVVVSSHSTKLLSIGVLLAAYEHELPVVAVSAMEYRLLGSVDEAMEGNTLVCIWLTGAPYDES